MQSIQPPVSRAASGCFGVPLAATPDAAACFIASDAGVGFGGGPPPLGFGGGPSFEKIEPKLSTT